MKVIETTNAPGAIGPYSQGYCVNGFVYTSGQIGIDPKTGQIPSGITAQAHQSCKNVMKNTITDGVTATVDLSTLSAEQTAALAAQLPESVRNTLFPTSTSSEEALASSEENGN